MACNKVPIRSEDDIYYAISLARRLMNQIGFSELDQQKVLVSVSELTRNVLDYANTMGVFSCELIDQAIHIVVQDEGPGIYNVDEVIEGEKNSSSRGLGLGLAGVKRLMDQFLIETSPNGTKITVTKSKGCKKRKRS